MKLIGPFTQILTMDHLPLKGALLDDQLEMISNGGILIDDEKIIEMGEFPLLEQKAHQQNIPIERTEGELVAIPGLIDAHTHLCWAGSRANDYAKRLSGKSYLEIANEGGGIWSTVLKTREATLDELSELTALRANQMLSEGVCTIEVKSGYGLTVENELKMLWAIKKAYTEADLIATCLAAHMCPKDFDGWNLVYLERIIHELLPKVIEEDLANRVDIFVEESAFNVNEAGIYLQEAKALGFDLVIHGDQFTVGGSQLAMNLGAISVDHLEVVDEETIALLGQSNVVATVLPGASLGLGIPFAPARKLLDTGVCLAIASDWNPGSAPNGDLLMQAALLGVYEKLTMAETLAGITFRAAKALNLNDRGILKNGNLADIAAFPCNDFREIIYRQGKLKPAKVWKKGIPIRHNK
ncbi:MAG: imidazolonepropionase [Prolixibacteraceae bacterium]